MKRNQNAVESSKNTNTMSYSIFGKKQPSDGPQKVYLSLNISETMFNHGYVDLNKYALAMDPIVTFDELRKEMADKEKIFRNLVSNTAVLDRLRDAYSIDIPPVDKNLNATEPGGKFIQLLLDDVLFTVSPIEKLPKGVTLFNAVTLPMGIRFKLYKYHWIPRN